MFRPPTGTRVFGTVFLVLTLSAFYLFAFPQTNLWYAAVVLLHVALGVAASFWIALQLWRSFRSGNWQSTSAWLVLGLGAILGLVLIKTGTLRADWNLLYAHILTSMVGVVIVLAQWPRTARFFSGAAVVRIGIIIVIFAGAGATAWRLRQTRGRNSAIVNPADAPADMEQEGDGPQGPFFPSSAQVAGGQKIPSKYFMESSSCERCHADIYRQWSSSAHHFSSFNNQWYRKSIEYMQDTVGTRPSKWCGGCHDPAVLYSGMMDTPIKQIVHRPEAQAGLGCMMCHSIAQVKSTMGQADFTLEYPELHELAASKNPLVRTLHDLLVKWNPEPHRRVFLKPFMREQTAEFCSSCHKVHLDVPVNHYRWIRGFNEYDNWQASGVSGQGARSFYYPQKPAGCADCHMPLTRSADQGGVNGLVHSHRFPAANTALPVANEDPEQLKATEDFLKDGALSVDIFALSAEESTERLSKAPQPELATTFAVGEESDAPVAPAENAAARAITAPLNRVSASVRRGDSVRVDVVVRTRKVGHFFPGGTVDAYDTWLELKGTDEKGQTIYWSGAVEDNGRGPVEKGAHFYRSLQIDGHSNPINKRNAWATRAVVYVHLIPPGAADTAHFRVRIPANAGNRITLHARLCYRKFAWWNTQFSFAGELAPGQPPLPVSPDHDDNQYGFTGSLAGVSAKQHKIPEVPTVALAEDEVSMNVTPSGSSSPSPATALDAADWQRWNDYGIGLLLQGDLKAAESAFEQVTQVAPANPDGYVNLGRVAVQEGDMERARAVLTKALSLSPQLARAHFFYAKVLRSEGRYDEAADHLRTVLKQYPRDRVALNDLGRTLFLERKYSEAASTLNQVLAIDPEDLQAHYSLMLCYQGLGDEKQAREHEARYRRFKADESSQVLTGAYRQAHPEDNNERQPIHEHASIPLPGIGVSRRAAASPRPPDKSTSVLSARGASRGE